MTVVREGAAEEPKEKNGWGRGGGETELYRKRAKEI